MVGSVLGVLFVSLVRRVLVEDPELPFPESVAASEIHKAGQRGAQAAKYLFWNIGVGGVVYCSGVLACSRRIRIFIRRWELGRSQVRLGAAGTTNVIAAGGASMLPRAKRESGLSWRGLHHRTGRLAALQFSGGVLAWGLMVPLLMYFLGPQLRHYIPADTPDDLG